MTIQLLLQITISEVLSSLMHAVSVVIWESLVERGGEGWSAIWGVWVSHWSWGKFKWLSLNHHRDGNIVVIGWVLDFVSILLSNGFERVIADDLSEGLQGNAVNNIERIGWGNLKGDGLNLIDWNVNWLGVLLEVILSLGLNEAAGSWSHSVGGVSIGLHEASVLIAMLVVVLLASSLVVLLMFVTLKNH